jgi:hypothetical protein
MKRCLILLALCAMSAVIVTAQVSLSLVVRTPMPSQLSVWEADQTLIQVIIVNMTKTSYTDVRLSFQVQDQKSGRTLLRSLDGHPAMPRFSLSGGSTVVRYGPSILNMQAAEVDPAMQALAIATNGLPEADYVFCIKLLAQDGTELAGTGQVCRNFSVVIPDPPSLINPENAAVVPAGVPPMFRWTSVVLGRCLSIS